MKKTTAILACMAAFVACGFEYDVSEPLIEPRCKGAQPGEWTLDRDAAFAQAKAEGKCTILLLTGAWWCPYCHTLEETVLVSDKWQEYVKERGFYLAEMDFSYRYDVPEGQEWKSWHPELGKGWGFKSWYMKPEYLAANGMTLEDGLNTIQADYIVQGELAVENAQEFTMSTWDGTSEFTYKRVGYGVLIVFGPDGEELGRVDFPWYSTSKVTASEAQEFEIQAIEQILNGECVLCKDPAEGTPDTSAAQTYTGWLSTEDGIAGEASFKLGRMNSKGNVKVSGYVKIDGKKTTFKAATVADITKTVELEKNGATASLTFGSSGMSGTIVKDGVAYNLSGGRNVFKAKDADSKASAAECPSGMWNVVLKPTEEASAFSRGYGTLNVTFKTKGKATVKGTLGDGTKVSVSTQTIIGENGVSCIPVNADLYSRKGGFGFVMWFKDGKFLSVTDVAPWVAAGKNAFSVAYDVATTIKPGVAAVEDEMDLSLMNFDVTQDFSGKTVIFDPSIDLVTIDGRKWTGTSDTLFKATCNAKTGVLKGSFTFFTGDENRPTKVKGKFTGISMGGSGYGTLVVKNVGCWAVKISACGSCGE